MPDDLDAKPGKRSDKSRGGCAVLFLVVLLFVLPVLYVASVGPAFWLEWRGKIDSETNCIIYWPLTWLCERSSFFTSALKAYLQWWAG